MAVEHEAEEILEGHRVRPDPAAQDLVGRVAGRGLGAMLRTLAEEAEAGTLTARRRDRLGVALRFIGDVAEVMEIGP
jgi:hypothetical protein